MLNRARHAILPAAALAAWAVTVRIDTLRGIDTGRDDLIPFGLTIVLSVWALLDYYFRRLTRDRKQALADRDLDVLAEGVAAAYQRISAAGRDGRHTPGPRAGC